MGVKACSAVMKTRMDCSPEQCEHGPNDKSEGEQSVHLQESGEELNPDSETGYTLLMSCKFLYFNL